MPTLIINADDFGLTEGISRGILDAHEKGVVTSTTVLPNGPAFGSTTPWLRDVPELGVGVHLALVGEDPPLLSSREIPTLVDASGRLAISWRRLMAKLLLGRVDLDDVRRELRAQIARVIDAGIAPTHLDSHQHVHLWPQLQNVFVTLAKDHGIRALRVPRSDGGRAAGWAVNALAGRLQETLRGKALSAPDGFAGFDEAGRMTLERFGAALDRFRRRRVAVAEVGVHPGAGSDPDRSRYRWNYTWEDELAVLKSQEIRGAVAEGGWTLGTYRVFSAEKAVA